MFFVSVTERQNTRETTRDQSCPGIAGNRTHSGRARRGDEVTMV